MATDYNIEPLLEVDGFKRYFQVNRVYTIRAVDDVSFKIWPGETYSLVGESGSGKSTIGRVVTRLYNPTAGTIQFNGVDIFRKMSRQTEKNPHRQIQMTFRDPTTSLSPRKMIGDIIGEGLDIHHGCQNAREREVYIKAMLRRVGLDPEYHPRYPHQFSGGQGQRVGIVRALMMSPRLITTDECISALDVSIQVQVVNLIKDIQEETETAYLFIAHDLATIKYISDRIGVLHFRHLLETESRDEIFSRPIHPYTRGLLSAIPVPNPIIEKQRIVEIYDYKTSGINYNKEANYLVEGTHYVRYTDRGFEEWVGATSHTRLSGMNQLY